MDYLELVVEQQSEKIMCLEAELVILKKALASLGVVTTERSGVEMGLKVIEEDIDG